MGAVTYPNPDVERFINEHFIPVQFNVVEQPEVMDQFNTPWTPTLIVQDAEGREHRRSQGYWDPAPCRGERSPACLNDARAGRNYEAAPARETRAWARPRGDPGRGPGALYWAPVG